jgi:hypothetical protein
MTRKQGLAIYNIQNLYDGNVTEVGEEVVIVLEDGSQYEGYVKDNNINGIGRLYFKDGPMIQEGEFKNGKLHGRGKVYINHEKGGGFFEGKFEDGKASELGKYVNPDGVRRITYLKDGEPVSANIFYGIQKDNSRDFVAINSEGPEPDAAFQHSVSPQPKGAAADDSAIASLPPTPARIPQGPSARRVRNFSQVVNHTTV